MPILDSFSLAGKVALLTGGAGLYGRQIVRGLAEAGACTYIASRHIDALEHVAALHRAEGHDVRALPLDLAEEASILSVRECIAADSGRLDVLVNNAVARPVKGLFDDAAHINESLRVNGTGLILVTRIMGQLMSDGGSIINIGSVMGLVGLEPPQGRNGESHAVLRQLLRQSRYSLQLSASRWPGQRSASRCFFAELQRADLPRPSGQRK